MTIARQPETPTELAERLLKCVGHSVNNCVWNKDGDGKPIFDHGSNCPAYSRAAIVVALGAEIAATRERIASALDHEASVCPCAEDAVVIRSCAALVRADFSYERAEEMEQSPPHTPS